MEFIILTIFPGIIDSYLKESLIKKGIDKGIIKIKAVNLRDFAEGIHKKVDDKPFGGGPGMVLQIEPIFKAVSKLTSKKNGKTRVILFSTRGKKFDAKTAKRLSKYDSVIFICGRYEGVDERVAKHIADEEISMGDFVLNGGELPALTVIEATSRFLPNFLGKKESLEEIKGSYPVYSRPAEYRPKRGVKAWKVPKILLSGNHADIDEWRKTKKARKS